MAGMSGEQDFNNVTKLATEIGDKIKAAMLALAEFFRFESDNVYRKQLGKSIASGEEAFFYQLPPTAVKEISGYKAKFIKKLEEAGIPHARGAEGSNMVCILRRDLEKVKLLDEQVLIGYAKQVRVVEADRYENAINHTKEIKDKNIFTMRLTTDEFQTLCNKCAGLSNGFTIGKGEKAEDGTREFMIREGQVFRHFREEEKTDEKKHIENKDFCRAYLETQLSLYGPNENIKKRQLDYDRKIERRVKELKDSDEVAYIVSANTPNKYIEINADQAEFYTFNQKDGKWHHTKIDRTDPQYDIEVKRHMNKLTDRAIVYTPGELHDHLDGKNIVQSGRVKLTKAQREQGICSDEIAEKIDAMVKEKMAQDNGIKEYKEPEKAFEEYKKETSKVLEAAIEDKVPEGYSKKDMDKIKDSFNSHSTDPETYRHTVEHIRTTAFEIRETKHERITEKTTEKDTITEERTR